ncbi:hypothetical protein NA57DRAFT_55583 [Rhizodiscina lignyota]|uniref:Uncharacterized protein n=1 Tax=Rhizodiscina lignyota TaxID=1504668 RepID=A0A9P4IHZ6_9PEZI|nr:hypothetical protein NA57DRAFT_55583 [Rhizodiscina lignyota]
MSSTLRRIEHFTSLTGTVDVAIVFHLTPKPNAIAAPQSAKQQRERLFAFSSFMSAMFSQTSTPAIPVLPLASASSLPAVLQTFASSLIKGHSVAAAAVPGLRPIELLQYCTVNSPLDQHSTFLLTDIFDSMGSLAGAMTNSTQNQEVEQKLLDLLGLETAQSVADFWRDEWVAD